jgi:hypothetical protein
MTPRKLQAGNPGRSRGERGEAADRKTERLQVPLSPEQVQRLRRAAKAAGITMAEQVRRLIDAQAEAE